MRKALLLMVLALLLAGAKPKAPCPEDMVFVTKTKTCIDRYEWPNRKGEKPLVGASARPSIYDEERGVTLNAWELCASVGKRMCSMEEWVPACKSKGGSDYPWGSKLPDRWRTPPDETPCNYAQMFRVPDEMKVWRRDTKEMERLDQSEPAGERGCISGSKAEDMMGNVEEWIICPRWMASKEKANCEVIDGEQVCFCLAGRYWSDAVKCHEVKSGHAPDWWYYETGFRCCLTP
jgi:formylglycine-generating enzyme required for sulfatase activity